MHLYIKISIICRFRKWIRCFSHIAIIDEMQCIVYALIDVLYGIYYKYTEFRLKITLH